MKYLKYLSVLCLLGYLAFAQDRYTRFHASDDTNSFLEVSSAKATFTAAEPQKVIFGPSLEVKETILGYLNGAQRRIYLSVYILTDESIISALVAAHGRGVDTRVLLESSVYNLPKVNQKAANILKKSGINVVFSSESAFNFNHSKYFLIDNIAMIASGNMTKSSLTINREVFSWYSDPNIVKSLETLFLADSEFIPIRSNDPLIILAPLNARARLESFILGAKKSLTLMSESFSDESLTKLFVNASERGVVVMICIPKNRPIESAILTRLQSAGVTINTSRGPHIHAKTLLRDENLLFYGSTNFTANSLDNNREVSAFITIPEAISNYKKIIESDCKS